MLSEVLTELLRHDVRLVSGVPCSILEPLQARLEQQSGTRYLPASVEGEAIALACGAWLAGGRALVLLQNSGLGNAVNPLVSLALPYRIPLVMVVSWRAQPGSSDAAHHLPMGEITPAMLDLLGVAQRVLGTRSLGEDFAWALAHAEAERKPVALIAPRGAFGKAAPRSVSEAAPARQHEPRQPRYFGTSAAAPATRRALRDAWLTAFPRARAVASTGYMARDLAELERHDLCFPMQGSMGFAAALALGMRVTRPGGKLCVLDGDGALWMRLGTLGTIGSAAPDAFAHIVADNGCYASTGGQPAPTAHFDFSRVALALGYAHAAECLSAEALPAALAWLSACHAGPAFLRCRIAPDVGGAGERPGLAPAELAARFRAAARASEERS